LDAKFSRVLLKTQKLFVVWRKILKNSVVTKKLQEK
jgi:hypothetical protein